jgi:hypothetical protein
VAWILLLSPPRLRPMLMGSNNGAVDQGIFVVRILGQALEKFLPNAAFGPAAEARVHHSEVTKPLRQITPRNPRAITIQNSIDK